MGKGGIVPLILKLGTIKFVETIYLHLGVQLIGPTDLNLL